MSLDHFDKTLDTHRLIQDLKWDAELRSQWHEDPDSVYATYDLSEKEVGALKTHDFGALYEMGVHQYLLAQLARLYFGTDERRGASEAASELMKALKKYQ